MPVAPPMSVQLAPAASHWRHWYAELVPAGVQLPPVAVRALPTVAVPEIVGRPVFVIVPTLGAVPSPQSMVAVNASAPWSG